MRQIKTRGEGLEVIPGRKIHGNVGGLYVAKGNHFATEAVDSVTLTHEGIEGDHHAGHTRRSGGREPWYPRGTEIRNSRQLTILAPDELAATAEAMGIDRIQPEWIGGNMLIEGLADLSMLPAGTLLFFEAGATLKIDFQNAPCKVSGAAIADFYPDRDQAPLALEFVKAAKRRRGLTAWVERPGRIAVGEPVRARIPEQWIYSA